VVWPTADAVNEAARSAPPASIAKGFMLSTDCCVHDELVP